MQGVWRKRLEAAFVSMDGNAVSARSVEEAASVTMGGGAVSAKSVEEAALVNMDETTVSARIVEEITFVIDGLDDVRLDGCTSASRQAPISV